MPDPGRCISREVIKVGNHSAGVTVREIGPLYVATWVCICGANGGDVVMLTTAIEAAERGAMSYRGHCAEAHPSVTPAKDYRRT